MEISNWADIMPTLGAVDKAVAESKLLLDDEKLPETVRDAEIELWHKYIEVRDLQDKTQVAMLRFENVRLHLAHLRIAQLQAEKDAEAANLTNSKHEISGQSDPEAPKFGDVLRRKKKLREAR